MESLNLSINQRYYGYTVLHSLGLSKGTYVLLMLGSFTITYIHYTENLGNFLAKTILSTIFYIVFIALAVDLSFIELIKHINVEIKSGSIYEIIEDLSVSLELNLRPKGIAKLINIKKVNLNSDIGLRTITWRFNELNHCLELQVSGYPGKHNVYGLTIDLETPLSILRMSLRVVLANPIEIKIIPTSSRHVFNVEAVVPYLFVFEGRASRRKGVGSEVFSVREFMPFDDFKRIHWKASAKVGKLMVKEYEHRMYRDTVIIISIHNGFFIGEPPPITFLTKMILDVVENLLSQGMKVAVGLTTEKDVKASTIVDRARVHEINKLLSNIEWPVAIDNKY
ncbi:MAG: DUF58 domain-containing protein, partial [Ignisphaera sp.]